MEVKLFEVRDQATLIPAMGIALIASATRSADQWLLERAGYAREQIWPAMPEGYERYVIFIRLGGDAIEAQHDPYAWSTHARTIPVAHRHVVENWDALESGDVIDVEYLMGKRPEPKRSERRG